MRKSVIGLLLVCSIVYAKAQSIEELFVKMPDDLVVQLEEAWRKDLVDLYKSGKTATLENTMQGKSTLQKLTNDYMLLQLTERSTVELKLLPLVNNTYIICKIETAYGPVADSRVSFYTTEWQMLPADGMFTPVTKDWFWNDGVDRLSPKFQDAVSMLNIYLVKYSLCAENMSLVAEYMTPSYIDKEHQEVVRPLLKTDNKTYEWKSGRFE